MRLEYEPIRKDAEKDQNNAEKNDESDDRMHDASKHADILGSSESKGKRAVLVPSTPDRLRDGDLPSGIYRQQFKRQFAAVVLE